ncbi:MAG TPA: YeeE/YedE thiosulfate transporter family protein [Sphingomonas sp.]|nr:YeeE/YedE thiosulfate transporter family protein [Sphingomonas sp.]
MESPYFLIALAAVGVMGFANQRGGTCTIAAIEEIVTDHRFGRLVAMFEASLWVAGGLTLLAGLGRLPVMPVSYAVGVTTFAGGALFGIGAFVNRACAFGSVTRIGSGDWAYLATPAGIYLGAVVASSLPNPAPLAAPSFMAGTPVWLAVGVAILLFARLCTHGWQIRRGGRAGLSHAWSPHLATTVIGIAFFVALEAAGPWTYTALLADLAHGATHRTGAKLALNLTLLGGAILGGWTAGRLKLRLPERRRLLRCLIGGTIMGGGARLIPGGNTSLVLLGLPLLRPYAWLGFASLCLTIYVVTRLAQTETKSDGTEIDKVDTKTGQKHSGA